VEGSKPSLEEIDEGESVERGGSSA
jgi:hypothetical protein